MPTTKVDELLVVDPEDRTVQFLRLLRGGYERASESLLLQLPRHGLESSLTWP
ncbi:MAG: hypothetical protein ACRDZX_16580 [Acidimicrobiales bacterium]